MGNAEFKADPSKTNWRHLENISSRVPPPTDAKASSQIPPFEKGGQGGFDLQIIFYPLL